jgi:microcystin-dependent protein
LWNNEWQNINTNFIPAGMDSYSDTDSQMQIQTAPYPGSVTSHASNLGGEIERIRYQISAIIGQTYWYNAPATNLATAQNVVVPVGGVIDYPSATPPNSSYLLANGQAIGRIAYATLFGLIGTAFGTGDGSTTFNIPNYTDRVSITAGNLYSLGATGGEASHTLLVAEMPAHNHTATSVVTDPGHQHSRNKAGGSNINVDNTGSTRVDVYGSPNANDPGSMTSVAGTGISIATTTTNTGGNGSHNVLNPYLAMYKMMRVS